jgi:cbb3-type cytochrome oxidase maturation protein
MALIIASALLVGLFSLAVLLWALSSGQYDDLDGDAVRILMDDPAEVPLAPGGRSPDGPA